MRGIVGLTLTGLGGFLVALALLMHFYVAGQVVRFPLNELSQTTLTGHDISWFDSKELTELTGVSAKATQSIQGDVEAGSRSTAVWEEFTSVQDVSNSQTITYTSRRSAFNRRTGALVNCCGSYVGTNAAVRQSGQGYVWPIGTQKKTYEVFDPVTLRPEPFRYTGTQAILGMPAYEFVEHVANQQAGAQTLQGYLVGSNSTSVTVPEYVTETNTVWVDPVSGIPLFEIQSQTQSLQYAGATQLVLFQGSLAETRQSAASSVAAAGSFDFREHLVQDIGPLASVLLGIVLLGIGVGLTGRVKTGGRSPLRKARSVAAEGYPQRLPEGGYPQRLPEGGYPQRLPEGGYAPGLSQPGRAPGWSGPGYAAELSRVGYQQDRPEAGRYRPERPESRYPYRPQQPPGTRNPYRPQQPPGTRNPYRPQQPPESRYPYPPQQPPENGYARGFPDAGYWAGPPESEYPPAQVTDPNPRTEFPGRMNDGIRRVLEPRPDQPRVGRHGRSRRNRT
jgi:hypothetical protein